MVLTRTPLDDLIAAVVLLCIVLVPSSNFWDALSSFLYWFFDLFAWVALAVTLACCASWVAVQRWWVMDLSFLSVLLELYGTIEQEFVASS